jgi:D-alanyl-D-alanine carboxypeptidase
MPLPAILLLLGLTVAAAPPTLDERFQAVIEGAAQQGLPAVSASVRWAGHTWTGTSGTASDASGEPLGTDARFRVASITKLVTAAVILQLVDEQQLSMEDSLASLLPEVAETVPNAQAITLAMLLNHQSGVRSYTDIQAFWREAYGERGLDRVWLPEELLAYAVRRRPYFAPGAPGQRHYSNTNYVLLGMIIERTTGEPLAASLRARVLEPLGMDRTSLEGFEPGMHAVQHAFHKADAGDRMVAGRRGWVPTSQRGVYDLAATYSQYNAWAWAWAAGGLSSTTADLGRLLDGLRGESLLSAPSRAFLFAHNSATSADGATFGGSGGWQGITASAFEIDGEVQVIVLANGTGIGVSANDVVRDLARIYQDGR